MHANSISFVTSSFAFFSGGLSPPFVVVVVVNQTSTKPKERDTKRGGTKHESEEVSVELDREIDSLLAHAFFHSRSNIFPL